jgi:hypothetical protein
VRIRNFDYQRFGVVPFINVKFNLSWARPEFISFTDLQWSLPLFDDLFLSMQGQNIMLVDFYHLKPPLAVLRRAGCPSSEYRKMESEGPAEKYRAEVRSSSLLVPTIDLIESAEWFPAVRPRIARSRSWGDFRQAMR